MRTDRDSIVATSRFSGIREGVKVLIQELAAPPDRTPGAQGQAVHYDQRRIRVNETRSEFDRRVFPYIESTSLANRETPFESKSAFYPDQRSIISIHEADVGQSNLDETFRGDVLHTMDTHSIARQNIFSSEPE
ncbi:MAG: hypothetical protein ABSC32_13855 [Steroidobacteraceae bacterium]